MEKKNGENRSKQESPEVGSEAWWEKRLASVRGGDGLGIIGKPPPRRTDDTTEDDSTCCDLDTSTSFTWG